MHSHHSHSGDYVSHAVDSLDSIVELAASKGFHIWCMTEHMPRLNNNYLYPEEIEKEYTSKDLEANFTKYLKHAKRLQSHYNSVSHLKLLVGFEVEGVDTEHVQYSKRILQDNPDINMTVGSVHHVHQVPIDFSAEKWLEARKRTTENTTRALYRDYFIQLKEVVEELKPSVVGHFDLIRLFEPVDEIDPTTEKPLREVSLEKDWPEVWQLVTDIIRTVEKYGGLFELNSAAIRKGWTGPYPKEDICRAIKELGGSRFCLSDDSHGLKQVGLNFAPTWTYAKNVLELDYLYHLDLEGTNTVVRCKSVEEVDKWFADNQPQTK